MKRIFLILLVALLLAGCASTDPTQTTIAPTQTTAGETDYSAPDFTMYTQDGTAVKLSELKGKPVILNFWASWCGPCKSEMPELEAAYQEYGDQIHFAIVNLTDGSRDTVEKASSYIQSQGYTFPVYFDTAMAGAGAYGVSSIPLTIFIDAQGDLVAYYTGAMTEEILQSGIDLLLNP